MDSPTQDGFSPRAADTMRIRQAATGTAIAAALLLFFGYGYLARPSGSDLFSQAWLVVYYALRIGGLVSASLAVWLWIGHRAALIIDALTAMTLGAIFALSGLVMLFDGGDVVQSAIIIVCGGTFVSSGLRNGRTYKEMGAGWMTASRGTPPPGVRSASQSVERRAGDAAALPERLVRRSVPTGPADAPQALAPGRERTATAARPERADDDSQSAVDGPVEPQPEGYLAAFARKSPPP